VTVLAAGARIADRHQLDRRRAAERGMMPPTDVGRAL
jgi:hypothetical protein